MAGPGSSASQRDWVENRSSAGGLALPRVREVLRYRELATVLALRDLQVRYKQTALGVAWAVLQPLVATGAFTLVFGRLADFDSSGIPYAVFVLAGLVTWNAFASGLTRCASSVVDNEDMISHVYFPRLVVCVAAVLPGLVDLAVGLGVLAVLMIVLGVTPGPELAALPAVIASVLLLTFGTGCLFAALNVRYRDVRNALPFALQIGLFVSPVAYSSSVASHVGTAYYLNPMAGLVEAFRWSVIGGPAPAGGAWLSAVTGFAVVVVGLLVFARMERRFADII